jgi:phage portal protein BeeE
MVVGVVVISFGNVGRSLALELIRHKVFRIMGFTSSKGAVIVRDREELLEAISLAERNANLAKHSRFTISYWC